MDTLLSESIRTSSRGATALSELLVAIRRHLHQNPEIGFEEYQTSAYIRETLESNGLDVVGPIARTGSYTEIVGSHPGPTIAYRADIDALPIQDNKDVHYKSKTNDMAHLCGHDAHTSMGIGVALILNKMRENLHGTVRVFFQPNEEGVPSGAPAMIEDGVLANAEAVYAVHVDPTLPTGTYGFIRGAATAAADRFEVTIRATSSGHSARPHQTVDTVWVATQITQAYYQLVGRLTDSRNPAIITICRFSAGTAFNVIPAVVSFGGTLRSTSGVDRKYLRNRLVDIGNAMGTLYDVEVDVSYFDGAPPVFNDASLIDQAVTVAQGLHGENSVVEIPIPSMGAEDFAYYVEQIPGAMLRVGTSSSPETSFALHDANFDIDEAALLPAAQLMAAILVNHLQSGG